MEFKIILLVFLAIFPTAFLQECSEDDNPKICNRLTDLVKAQTKAYNLSFQVDVVTCTDDELNPPEDKQAPLVVKPRVCFGYLSDTDKSLVVKLISPGEESTVTLSGLGDLEEDSSPDFSLESYFKEFFANLDSIITEDEKGDADFMAAVKEGLDLSFTQLKAEPQVLKSSEIIDESATKKVVKLVYEKGSQTGQIDCIAEKVEGGRRAVVLSSKFFKSRVEFAVPYKSFIILQTRRTADDLVLRGAQISDFLFAQSPDQSALKTLSCQVIYNEVITLLGLLGLNGLSKPSNANYSTIQISAIGQKNTAVITCSVQNLENTIIETLRLGLTVDDNPLDGFNQVFLAKSLYDMSAITQAYLTDVLQFISKLLLSQNSDEDMSVLQKGNKEKELIVQ